MSHTKHVPRPPSRLPRSIYRNRPRVQQPTRTALWIVGVWVVACLFGGVALGFAGCGGPNRQDPEPAGCSDKGTACAGKPAQPAPAVIVTPDDHTTSTSTSGDSDSTGLPSLGESSPVKAAPTL